MLNMTPDKLYPMIKKLKISQSELADEMGYSKVYISRLMNGHGIGDKKFHKLLVSAIAKKSKKDYEELCKLLNGTEWENYLP